MYEKDLIVFDNMPPAGAPCVREFVNVGMRWRGRMLVIFGIVMVGALLAATRWDYESEAKFLVRKGRVDPPVTAGQSRAEIRNDLGEEELNNEIELLRSDDVLRKVVLQMGLQKTTSEPLWFRLSRPQAADSEAAKLDNAVRVLTKVLEITLPRRSDVITVRYRAGSPKVAAGVLGALSNAYLEKHRAVHRPPGEFEFFARQAEEYRRKLADAESRLAGFSRAGGTVAGPTELETSVRKLSDLKLTYQQSLTAIAEAEKRIANLQEQMTSTPARMTTAVRTAENPHLMMQLKTTQLSLEMKRTELLKKYQPTYREVQELDKQIGETNAAIAAANSAPPRDETTDRDPTYEWLRAELAKEQATLTGLQAKANSLAQTIPKGWDETRKLQQSSLREHDLAREAKTLEESYQLYVRKRDEASISDDMDRRNILNVSVLQEPTLPVLPRRSPSIVLLGGLMLAIVMSVGVAFISDYLDDSIRTPDALRSLNVPVLAMLVRDDVTIDPRRVNFSE